MNRNRCPRTCLFGKDRECYEGGHIDGEIHVNGLHLGRSYVIGGFCLHRERGAGHIRFGTRGSF